MHRAGSTDLFGQLALFFVHLVGRPPFGNRALAISQIARAKVRRIEHLVRNGDSLCALVHIMPVGTMPDLASIDTVIELRDIEDGNQGHRFL
jgi:hypothetical protein